MKCFSSHMSWDRFLLILRCLHCSIRQIKVRIVVDYFNNRYFQFIALTSNCLSRSVWYFGWRQTPQGLILRLIIYCGRMDDMGGQGHTGNAVLLMKPFIMATHYTWTMFTTVSNLHQNSLHLLRRHITRRLGTQFKRSHREATLTPLWSVWIDKKPCFVYTDGIQKQNGKNNKQMRWSACKICHNNYSI